MAVPEPYATALKAIDNANGIVQLRLESDEWARTMGEKMIPTASTKDLVKMILHLGAGLLADLDSENPESD